MIDRKIVAIDLGTKTGYAITLDSGRNGIHSGMWELASEKQLRGERKAGRIRSSDPRVRALFDRIRQLHRDHDAFEIWFEDVQFHTSLAQSQLWSSLRGALWTAAPGSLTGVPVGTLKKFATGHGNATKEMMAEALYRREPELRGSVTDDNEIDARWLLHYALNDSTTKH